jgi:ATP-dependent helicase/nuclease subunit B
LLRDEAGIAGRFELVALRGRGFTTKRSFAALLADARHEIEADEHRHPAIARIGADEWSAIATLAGNLDRALRPLLAHAQNDAPKPLADHLEAVLTAANHLSGAFTHAKDDASRAVVDMLVEMRRQSNYHPPGRFDAAVATLRDQLRRRVVRASAGTHPRLIIYGLLEARLMHADTVILGGLNEGKWPEQPETGPWLNRPMRRTLDLAAPEREIGLTAHDFVQAFGNANVVLTWSARLGGQPALPSRWILRLKLLLEAVGKWQELHASPWLVWSAELDRAQSVNPVPRPRPRPPLAARPNSISISRVETLQRDPYAIYAQQVLRLEPLEDLGATPDARLRGELIHEILDLYHRKYPAAPPNDIEKTLHELGAQVFAPYRDEPEVAAIWLPRFARIAKWFATHDAGLRRDASRVIAECTAGHEFTIAGETFKLTGRADRIDLLADGTARILDFKTGTAPGVNEAKIGLSPQLTLEAALLARGAFTVGPEKLAPTKSSRLAYVRLTGGEPPGEQADRGEGVDEVMAMAEDHLAKLEGLLAKFALVETAYMPRCQMKKEDDASDYDHLSRHGEWIMTE